MATDGKPRIGAILSAIRARGDCFAGIINSDCRIMGYPDLAANFRAGLEGTCVLAWRLDVGEGRKPAAARHGFDAYFFDVSVIPEDDFGFSIGDPWWDYWFPLACEMRGAKLETLAVPLLVHKVHPLNWRHRNWDDGAQRFWAALQGWRPSVAVQGSLFEEIPAKWWKRERLSAFRVGAFSLLVPLWFHRATPQTIALMPSTMPDVEAMLRVGGGALLDATEFTMLRNMIRRMVRPLRLAVAAYRRFRWGLSVAVRQMRWRAS